MQKMSSLFVRELTKVEGFKRPVYLAQREYHEDADWVEKGYGLATRKWDGTCCKIKDGALYCRRHRKFIPVDFDDINCKWHHKWLADNAGIVGLLPNGTYELCGPGIQGNPEGLDKLTLKMHGLLMYNDVPRDYDGLRDWLAAQDIEGLVWHHLDGRMIKIKKCDFALPRRPPMSMNIQEQQAYDIGCRDLCIVTKERDEARRLAEDYWEVADWYNKGCGGDGEPPLPWRGEK